MAEELTVHVDNGTAGLSQIGRVLASAGVGIRGLCVVGENGRIRSVRLIFENGAAARSALQSAGHVVRASRELVILDLRDRPGVFSTVMGILAAAGIEVEVAYTSGPWLAIGCADPDAARAVFIRARDAGSEGSPSVIRAIDPPMDAPIGGPD